MFYNSKRRLNSKISDQQEQEMDFDVTASIYSKTRKFQGRSDDIIPLRKLLGKIMFEPCGGTRGCYSFNVNDTYPDHALENLPQTLMIRSDVTGISANNGYVHSMGSTVTVRRVGAYAII